VQVIMCDDVLCLCADKTKTIKDVRGVYRRYKIGLKDDWKKNKRVGIRAVKLYWNKNDKYISVEEYNKLNVSGQSEYYPICEYEYKTAKKNDIIRLYGNRIEIRLTQLSRSDEARLLMNRYKYIYSLFLSICDDLFFYKGRSDLRGRVEAQRQKLKNRFYITKYEYNIMVIDEGLGRAVYHELLELYGSKKYPDMVIIGEGDTKTIYLQGFKNSGKVKIKYYNAGYRDLLLSGVYKLEMTFTTQHFKKNNIKLKDCTFQENIISSFLPLVFVELDRWGKRGVVMKQLQKAFFNDKENILARVIKLEREQERQGVDIALLKKQVAKIDKLEKLLETQKELVY
jgi:hypothetical protein